MLALHAGALGARGEQLSIYSIGAVEVEGEGEGPEGRSGAGAVHGGALVHRAGSAADQELLKSVAEESPEDRAGETHVSRRRALCRGVLAGAATAIAAGVGSTELLVVGSSGSGRGPAAGGEQPGQRSLSHDGQAPGQGPGAASRATTNELDSASIPAMIPPDAASVVGTTSAVATGRALKQERGWLESRVTRASPVVGVAVPAAVGSGAGPLDGSCPLEAPEAYEELLQGVLRDEWNRSAVLPCGLGPQQIAARVPSASRLAFEAEDLAESQARQAMGELHAMDAAAHRVERGVWHALASEMRAIESVQGTEVGAGSFVEPSSAAGAVDAVAASGAGAAGNTGRPPRAGVASKAAPLVALGSQGGDEEPEAFSLEAFGRVSSERVADLLAAELQKAAEAAAEADGEESGGGGGSSSVRGGSASRGRGKGKGRPAEDGPALRRARSSRRMSSSDLAEAAPIIEAVQGVLSQYAGLLRGVFRLYAGGGSQWKPMSSSQFMRLLKDCRVLGKRGGGGSSSGGGSQRRKERRGGGAAPFSRAQADELFHIANRESGVPATLDAIREHQASKEQAAAAAAASHRGIATAGSSLRRKRSMRKKPSFSSSQSPGRGKSRSGLQQTMDAARPLADAVSSSPRRNRRGAASSSGSRHRGRKHSSHHPKQGVEGQSSSSSRTDQGWALEEDAGVDNPEDALTPREFIEAIVRVACAVYADLRVGAVAREGGQTALEALEDAGAGVGVRAGGTQGVDPHAAEGARSFDEQAPAPMHVRLEFMLSRHLLRHANSREPGVFRVALAQDGPQLVIAHFARQIRAVFEHACRSQHRHWVRRYRGRWEQHLVHVREQQELAARRQRRRNFGIEGSRGAGRGKGASGPPGVDAAGMPPSIFRSSTMPDRP